MLSWCLSPTGLTLVAHAIGMLVAAHIFLKVWGQDVSHWKIVARTKVRETMTWTMFHFCWNAGVAALVVLTVQPYAPAMHILWPSLVLYLTMRLYLHYKATWWAANGSVDSGSCTVAEQ